MFSCSSQSRKNASYDLLLTDFKKSPAYSDVRSAAQQHLLKWIKADLEEIHILSECKWKLSDDVFFNSTKDRAYLLLLIQDSDQGAELDYVYPLYAALQDDQWVVYFSGLPGYVFPRERFGEHKQISFEQLSRISRDEVLNGYLDDSGKISDEYVNKAYTPELRKKHIQFLNRKYQ